MRRAVTLAIIVATPSLAAAFATDLPLPPYQGAAAHACAALLLARRGKRGHAISHLSRVPC